MATVNVEIVFRFIDNEGKPITTGYVGAIKVLQGGSQNWATDTRYELSHVGEGYYSRTSWAADNGWYDIYAHAGGVEGSATYRKTIPVIEKRRLIEGLIDDGEVTPQKTSFMEGG